MRTSLSAAGKRSLKWGYSSAVKQQLAFNQ